MTATQYTKGDPVNPESEGDEEEYTFYVDLPGLAIVRVPGRGIEVEVDLARHSRDTVDALLSTLHVEVDVCGFSYIRQAMLMTTKRKEPASAKGKEGGPGC